MSDWVFEIKCESLAAFGCRVEIKDFDCGRISVPLAKCLLIQVPFPVATDFHDCHESIENERKFDLKNNFSPPDCGKWKFPPF